MSDFKIGDIIIYSDEFSKNIERNALIIGKRREGEFIVMDEQERPMLLSGFYSTEPIDKKFYNIKNWRLVKEEKLKPFDYKYRENGSTKLFEEAIKFIEKITEKKFSIEENKNKIETLVKQAIFAETPYDALVEEKRVLDEEVEKFLSEEVDFFRNYDEEKLEKVLNSMSGFLKEFGEDLEYPLNLNFNFPPELLNDKPMVELPLRKVKCKKCSL